MNLIDDIYNKIPNIGQNRSELEELYNYLKDKEIKNVLEIGTQFGGTFYLWCSIATGKKISVDLIDGDFGGISSHSINERNNNFYNYWFPSDKEITFIEGNSKNINIFNKVSNILKDEKLDILFIDGDHSYEGVKSDYDIYKSLVKDGGFIIFHDINEIEKCGVSEFWNSLTPPKIEFNHHTSWILNGPIMGGIGLIIN